MGVVTYMLYDDEDDDDTSIVSETKSVSDNADESVVSFDLRSATKGTPGNSLFRSEDDIATVSSDDEFVSESVLFLATNMTPGASLSGSDDVFVSKSFISSGSGAVIIRRPGASTTGSDDNTDKPAGTPDSIVTVLNSDSVIGIIRSIIVLMIFM